jgi:crotonobetainyl-CoA:carnitine CoA-transferase CaiB-like acyl-CoA transferase
MNTPTVLEGLKALDLTRGLSGAIATMVLADNGARVTRVESSGTQGADFSTGLPGYHQWHRGKETVQADLTSRGDLEKVRGIAAQADVVVETMRPGAMERLGLGYDTLKADNPGVVYCAITGFGPKGAYQGYKGYDGTVQAKVGRMNDFGVTFGLGRPVFSAVPVAAFGASQAALQGIVAALYVRQKTGLGQRVDTSLVQGMFAYDMMSWFNTQMAKRAPEKVNIHARTQPIPTIQYIPARTRDGEWLQFANHAAHLFWAQVDAIGLGHIREDPIFAPLPHEGTMEANMAFWEMVLERVQEKTYAEWLKVLQAAGDVGVDLFTTTEAGMDHPQGRHNGHVVQVHHPELGPTEQLGPLVRMSATPSIIGQPNGHSTGTPRTSSTNGATPSQALADVTAMELAVQYAAPYGPTMLTDMGIRVIKIEPLTGDTVRALPGLAAKTLLGRESISIDLKRPEGQEIVARIAKISDILMHNYRPGVPNRLGIDYESLKQVNPDLVHLYAGAYGSDGPYASMPAYHPISGAVCGNAVQQAGAGFPPPKDLPMTLEELKEVSLRLSRANEGNPDATSSLVVGTAMLLGLLARERQGVGQEMLTTMICANAYALSDDWIRYQGKPPRKEVDSDLLGLGALYRLYETSQGWVFLAAVNDAEWRALCSAIGEPSMADDPLFATSEAREANDAVLADHLSAVLRSRTADDWEAALTAQDVACVRADGHSVGGFFDADPSARENGFVADTVHPEHGPMWRHANNVTMSLAPPVLGRCPDIGQHTRAIMREVGYTDDEITGYKARAIVNYPE